MGAKSNNLAALRGKLPEWINLPPSVAVPFSTFEAVLDAPQNSDVKASLMGHYELVKGGDVSALATCRQAIESLTPPPQLQVDPNPNLALTSALTPTQTPTLTPTLALALTLP